MHFSLNTHCVLHSIAIVAIQTFRQVLLFPVNLCLLVDCSPPEEQGRRLVLKAIGWPIYVALIDLEDLHV